MLFSNSLDPYQWNPIETLRSGSKLFENVNIFKKKLKAKFGKNPQKFKNIGMDQSAVLKCSNILFRGQRVKTLLESGYRTVF